MLQAADLYRRGLPPVIGGSLDQAQWFVEAALFAWQEDNRWRSELKLEAWR